jgi:hypothetical protein
VILLSTARTGATGLLLTAMSIVDSSLKLSAKCIGGKLRVGQRVTRDFLEQMSAGHWLPAFAYLGVVSFAILRPTIQRAW